MTLKTCKTAIRASAFLATIALSGGVFATDVAADSYNFETGTFAEQLGLAGNGTIVDGTPAAPRVGYPLTTDAHAKVLEIAGTVTYTNAGDSAPNKSSQVDFMFKVEPTDELENPTDSDIHVALAVGTGNETTGTAPIKLWCKKVSGDASADWVTLKESVATGSWVRATLVLDYNTTPGRCKVSLDGDPVLNPSAEAAAQGSEWFYFAGTATQNFVKSISMVGSTKVDDLKVSYDALDSYMVPVPANTTIADGSDITYDYINRYGVTVVEATSSTPLNAESGMTVAQKFAAGLDPKSATKFALQTMTTTKSTATVTFPGTNPVGSYMVKAKTADGTQVATGTITKTSEAGENVNSAAITIPAEKQDELLYFTVETVTP